MHIVGEAKSPDALRNASDQFFEWVKSESAPVDQPVPKPSLQKTKAGKQEATKAAGKQHPMFVVEAVTLLAADTPDGKVTVSGLGSYLKRADPSFSPKNFGHSGLLDMLKTYGLLKLHQEAGGHWTVQLTSTSSRADP